MRLVALLLAALPLAAGEITADELRGYISFLSSDLLEGRGTPSRGLDITAEYIASEFRAAGVQPVNGSYFTSDAWIERRPPKEAPYIRIAGITPNANEITADGAANLTDSIAVWVTTEADVSAGAGKVLLASAPTLRGQSREERIRRNSQWQALLRAMRVSKPALIVILAAKADKQRSSDPSTLFPNAIPMRPPQVVIYRDDLKDWFAHANKERPATCVNARMSAPIETSIALHNVIGMIPGTDPVLKNTYVIVSAHYDHLGLAPEGQEDRIFNGANDDASGVAGVIALAHALAKSPPRRGILFLCYYGEEKGLYGSRAYTRHPALPLKDAVAALNLEQLGRTDDSAGPQVNAAAVTGFDYSTVGEMLETTGAKFGVHFFKDPQNSDAYFSASDNQPLADAGVPAHTISVAYEFPDYHKVSDSWEKIDAGNMASVLKAVEGAIVTIANSEARPAWNAANPKTSKYVEAANRLQE